MIHESAVDFVVAEENALMDFQFAILDELEVRGWTQARLAMELGVSRARVSQMLSAEANPTLKLAARALAVLGLKCDYASAKQRKVAQKAQVSRFTIYEAHSWAMAVAWNRPEPAANENYDELLQAA